MATFTETNKPRNYLLTDFMIWVSLKCLFKISYDITLASYGNFEQCLSALNSLIFPYLLGAVGADFVLVSYGAIALYVLLFSAILSKNVERAKMALISVFVLTIITVFIEHYLTVIFVPSSAEGWCGYLLNLINFINIPFLFSCDIAFTAIRVFLGMLVFSEIVKISTSSSGQQTIVSSHNNSTAKNPKNLFICLLIGFFSAGMGGYFYLGQVKKGIVFSIISLILGVLSLGLSLGMVSLLGLIDTYRLTRRNNKLGSIGEWETCLNVYTVPLAFVLALPSLMGE